MVSKLEKAEMFLEAVNGSHKSTTKYVPCELLKLSCVLLTPRSISDVTCNKCACARSMNSPSHIPYGKSVSDKKSKSSHHTLSARGCRQLG